jgi:small ligand-binding sensory domain FIST
VSDLPESNRAASRLVRTTFDEGLVSDTIAACRADLGDDADPTLAFVFCTPDWRPHVAALTESVQVDGHAPVVIGCSGAGLVGVGQEDEDVSGFSILLLSLPNTDTQVVDISTDQLDRAEAGEDWRSITGIADNRDEDPQNPDIHSPFGAWIALANPLHMQSEAWLRNWNTAYDGVPTFGGLASGPADPDGMFLFRESGITDAALTAVHFSGGVRIGGVVSQGCRPIGEPYTVTEADDNMLISVGSRPAFEKLEEAFESLDEELREEAQGNIFAGLAVSEYVDDFQRGDFLVRNILGGDPTAGVLALGALPRVGQTMQFQLRDSDSADEDLRLRCAAAQTRYGEPFAGLMFTCAGRGSHLFGIPNHDAGIVEDVFGRIPLSGFFCNGEIGPVGGLNHIHGYTASTAFFLNA